MILKKLTAKNLYSFRELEFEFARGLFLIIGENVDSPLASSNYSGKSNIFESLMWTLYGKGTKETKPDGSPYPSVTKEQVIHNGESDCRGEVEVESDGISYTIVRTRNQRGGDLYVVSEGKKLSGKSISETQKIVDSILGMSFETFLQSVMFAQGSKRFTQAKDSEIKELFGEVLGFSIWENAKNEVKKILKNQSTEIVKNEQRLSYITAQLNGLSKAYEVASSAYQRALDIYENWELKHAGEIGSIKESIAETQRELLSRGVTIACVEDSFKEFSEQQNKELKELEAIRSQIQIKSARRAEVASDLSSNKCPVCEQTVESTYLNNLLDKYSTDAEYVEYDCLLNATEARKRTLALLDDLVKMNTKLNRVKEESNPFDVPCRKDTSSVESDIIKLKAEAEERKEEIESLKAVVDKYKILEEAFGDRGVKSLLLDNILPVLNERVAEYSSSLAGSDTRVRFDTETVLASGDKQDKFSIIVETSGGTGYHLCSGGERRRIDFAISLALQSLLPQTNIFICDEPFESVDEAGQVSIIELLRQFAETRDVGIYVITHIPQFQDQFDSKILVRKENGNSRIYRM